MAQLSICVLVRNEADLLQQCLSSLGWVQDEIIVVDNGSTDHSPRVAERMGCRVISAPFHDFDCARNLYLDAATNPWILVLDADEVMTPDALNAIKESLDRAPDSTGVYTLPFYNYLGNGRWACLKLIRLIRNDSRIRYTTNGIHDTVRYSVARIGAAIGELVSPIHHLDGLYVGRPAAKRRRYITALTSTLAKGNFGPENPASRLYCLLGMEYLAIGYLRQAEIHLLRALDPTDPLSEDAAHVYLANVYLRLGRLNDAVQHVESIRSLRFGPIVQVPTIRAEIALLRGDRDAALQIFGEALLDDPNAAHLHLNMAALILDESPEKALDYLRAATINPYVLRLIIYGPGDPHALFSPQDVFLSCTQPYYKQVSRVLTKLGDHVRARQWASVEEEVQRRLGEGVRVPPGERLKARI